MGLGAEISAYRFLCFKTNPVERSFSLFRPTVQKG